MKSGTAQKLEETVPAFGMEGRQGRQDVPEPSLAVRRGGEPVVRAQIALGRVRPALGELQRATTDEGGAFRVDRLRVLCRDADERRAHLRVAARLDSDREVAVTVLTSIDGADAHEEQLVVAAGQNEIEWNVDIVDPTLWWPRALGDQPLVDVDVDREPVGLLVVAALDGLGLGKTAQHGAGLGGGSEHFLPGFVRYAIRIAQGMRYRGDRYAGFGRFSRCFRLH